MLPAGVLPPPAGSLFLGLVFTTILGGVRCLVDKERFYSLKFPLPGARRGPPPHRVSDKAILYPNSHRAPHDSTSSLHPYHSSECRPFRGWRTNVLIGFPTLRPGQAPEAALRGSPHHSGRLKLRRFRYAIDLFPEFKNPCRMRSPT